MTSYTAAFSWREVPANAVTFVRRKALPFHEHLYTLCRVWHLQSSLLTCVLLTISSDYHIRLETKKSGNNQEFLGEEPTFIKKIQPYHLLIIKEIYFCELFVTTSLFVVQHKPTNQHWKEKKKSKKEDKLKTSKCTFTVTKITDLEIGKAFSKIRNNQLPKQPCSEKDFEKQSVIIYWILMYVLLCGINHSLRK